MHFDASRSLAELAEPAFGSLEQLRHGLKLAGDLFAALHRRAPLGQPLLLARLG